MNQSIYQSPASEIATPLLMRENLGRVLSIIGCILQVGIIYGVMMFIIEMVNAFQEITLYGYGDPKVMAGMISSALVNVILGSVVAFPGLLINILALSTSTYGATWLFRFLITVSIFWMLVFPIGTVFGIILIVITFKKSKNHLQRASDF